MIWLCNKQTPLRLHQQAWSIGVESGFCAFCPVVRCQPTLRWAAPPTASQNNTSITGPSAGRGSENHDRNRVFVRTGHEILGPGNTHFSYVCACLSVWHKTLWNSSEVNKGLLFNHVQFCLKWSKFSVIKRLWQSWILFLIKNTVNPLCFY